MDWHVQITDRSALQALAHLQRQAPFALRKGLLKFGLLTGRAIAQRAPQRTRRLARSFLVPVVSATQIILGRGVPIYGAIHEYGGVIKAKRGPFLIFQIDGQWISTPQVTIREKRFARGGLEATTPLAPLIIGREIAAAFHD